MGNLDPEDQLQIQTLTNRSRSSEKRLQVIPVVIVDSQVRGCRAARKQEKANNKTRIHQAGQS